MICFIEAYVSIHSFLFNWFSKVHDIVFLKYRVIDQTNKVLYLQTFIKKVLTKYKNGYKMETIEANNISKN